MINCRNDDLMMMTLKMMMTTQKQTLRRKLMHLETMEPKIFQSRNTKQTKLTNKQTNDDDFEDDNDYSKTNVETKADAP